MKAGDVTDTLELALEASGCDSTTVRHKPRLLSDNGSSYISHDLAEWLDDQGMDHVRGAPKPQYCRPAGASRSGGLGAGASVCFSCTKLKQDSTHHPVIDAQLCDNEVRALPIRLTHSPTTCRVLPFP